MDRYISIIDKKISRFSCLSVLGNVPPVHHVKYTLLSFMITKVRSSSFSYKHTVLKKHCFAIPWNVNCNQQEVYEYNCEQHVMHALYVTLVQTMSYSHNIGSSSGQSISLWDNLSQYSVCGTSWFNCSYIMHATLPNDSSQYLGVSSVVHATVINSMATK